MRLIPAEHPPTAPHILGNNLAAILFTVVMLRPQHMPAYTSVLSEATDRRPAEALRTVSPSAGERETFAQLALPLFASLYNHAFWLTQNQVEAEDLVQEALSKSLCAFDQFEQGTNFKAWIFCILRNTFLTSRTGIAATRTGFLEDHPEALEIASNDPTPEDNVVRLDDLEALYAAIDQLPIPLRDAVLLCDVEELKYRDIAVVLSVPIGTVMSRVSRARQALRQIMQSQYR